MALTMVFTRIITLGGFILRMEDFMMDGNDGGMNITHDGGETWRFIGNIPVAQFYHIAVDNEFPYNVYGGMQDNGSLARASICLERSRHYEIAIGRK